MQFKLVIKIGIGLVKHFMVSSDILLTERCAHHFVPKAESLRNFFAARLSALKWGGRTVALPVEGETNPSTVNT